MSSADPLACAGGPDIGFFAEHFSPTGDMRKFLWSQWKKTARRVQCLPHDDPRRTHFVALWRTARAACIDEDADASTLSSVAASIRDWRGHVGLGDDDHPCSDDPTGNVVVDALRDSGDAVGDFAEGVVQAVEGAGRALERGVGIPWWVWVIAVAVGLVVLGLAILGVLL